MRWTDTNQLLAVTAANIPVKIKSQKSNHHAAEVELLVALAFAKEVDVLLVLHALQWFGSDRPFYTSILQVSAQCMLYVYVPACIDMYSKPFRGRSHLIQMDANWSYIS
jgi:hypothetical protein